MSPERESVMGGQDEATLALHGSEKETLAVEDIERLRSRLLLAERDLNLKRKRIDRELELAARVHRSLLPQAVDHERIAVDIRYLPVEEVGGDYCQVRFADPGTCYITVCDVTGHGIGPALLATRVSSEVRHGILYGRAPCDIVRSLNQFIREHFEQTDLFLTMFAARIELRQRRITYCGAGHPCPLLLRREGLVVEQLDSQNPMIGILDDCLSDEPENTVDLLPGDRLVFYTDGFTETADINDHYLGVAGLAEIARDAMSVGLFQSSARILDRVAAFQHGPATDDKTLIVAEIK